MRSRIFILGGAVLLAGWAALSLGAAPTSTMQRQSSDVLEGRVMEVYSVRRGNEPNAEIKFVAEVKVEKVSKGDLRPGALIYIRYAQRPGSGPDSSGATATPAANDLISVYLQRDRDGGLDVFGSSNAMSVLRQGANRQ